MNIKIKNFFFRFWPIFAIFLVWFVFSSPYFLKNKVPYPSMYQVNHFHPWSLYEKFWGPVKNGAMPDVVDQIYPWKRLTIDTWKMGQIPLWNPYNFAGNPNLANFQSAVLSPFNVLFFIFSFADALSLLVLFQPLLAAIFMYLFTRSLKVSQKGSLISSFAFMFCGFITSWMVYGTLAYAILFLPLALYAIEKYYETKKLYFLFILLFSIPLSFFSGHFQISLYFSFFVISYILFKLLITKDFRVTLFVLFSGFLGFLISLLQIFPSIELYAQAVRSTLFIAGEIIPWSYIPTIIAPDFYGNPVTRNDWFGHYAEWNAYIGIFPISLAIYAILKTKKPQVIFLFCIGILSLLLAFDTPLFVFLVNFHIPVISTSAASRIIVLFSFSFAALAGFGFDKLMEDITKKRIKGIIFWLAGFFIIILALWLTIYLKLFLPYDKLSISKSNLILPTLLFISFLFLTLSMLVKNKKIILIAPFLLIFIVVFDMFRFAQKWMPFDKKEFVFPNMQVIEALKKNIGYGRVFGNLGAQINSYYGIGSVEGYDPLYIARYGEFARSSRAGNFLESETSVVKIDIDGKYLDRFLDLMGVSVIYHPISDTNQGWAYPVWKDQKRFSLIFNDGTTQLFKNNTAMARAALFYNYEVIRDKKDIINRFYNKDFDFRNSLILEEDPNLITKKETKSPNNDVKIMLYTPDKVIIKVVSSSPGLLFLSDNFYPRWKAKVNEKESKIYRADYSFRAVLIPSGESKVEFIYSFF